MQSKWYKLWWWLLVAVLTRPWSPWRHPGDAPGTMPALGQPVRRGGWRLALPFLIDLHPIARSSALETAARNGACLARLGWSSAAACTGQALDSVAGVNQDGAPFNSLVAYTIWGFHPEGLSTLSKPPWSMLQPDYFMGSMCSRRSCQGSGALLLPRTLGQGCTVCGVASAEQTLLEEFAFLSPPVGNQREHRS